MSTDTDKQFILLHKTDNVFVCCKKALANETIKLEGDHLVLTDEIEVGHKLARRDIKSGGKIFKYGVSIGSAKADIKRAEHVHLHNLKSDYIPSHIRSGIVSDKAPSKEELL